MVPKVAEYLDGKINCKLMIDGKAIIEDQSNKAALENYRGHRQTYCKCEIKYNLFTKLVL